jgi:type IV secretory pathway TraG/TraD family ATPase VirD4
MKIEIGRNVKGGGVYLVPADFITHLHILGLTRSGKSMWLYHLITTLLKLRKPMLVLDPHGDLYRKILALTIATNLRREIVLFDPSYESKIVGFNPFQTSYTDEGRKMTKAERLSQQLMRVFGMENTDQFGNIERLLRALFYAILDLQLSICDLRYFLYWEYEKERKAMIERISSEQIKADLRELYSSKAEFEKKIGSTKNKLQRFTHPQMRRIMGLKENNVDLPALIEKQRVMLCNLQASETDLVGRENMKALGTLLISELWESFRKRTKPQEFYLIVDEMQEFMTPDLVQILPQSAKYGLHCILAHQHPGQLSPAVDVAIKNAQTKVIFSTEQNPKQQRYFTLRKTDHTIVEAVAPVVQPYQVPQEKTDRYVETKNQYFFTPEEVDARLHKAPSERRKLTTEDFIR